MSDVFDIQEARAEILDLREQVAALESREVCAAAHENVETCGYCQRDAFAVELATAKESTRRHAQWVCDEDELNEQLKARIATLEAENTRQNDRADEAEADVRRLEGELKFQKELLSKYHAQNCSKDRELPHCASCSCGLTTETLAKPNPRACVVCGFGEVEHDGKSHQYVPRGPKAETDSKLCPHGFVLADNTFGPCSQGAPNRTKYEPGWHSEGATVLDEMAKAYAIPECKHGKRISQRCPECEAAGGTGFESKIKGDAT